jgi:hypothetical protein
MDLQNGPRKVSSQERPGAERALKCRKCRRFGMVGKEIRMAR